MLKKLIKKIAPDHAIQSASQFRKRVVKTLASYVIPWAASSRWTSQLYYTLFSRAFAREQRAVLYGRTKYNENLECQDTADELALLRRNTHRLEKGLLMRPRRDVFALGYIQETVHAYAQRANGTDNSKGSERAEPDIKELSWTRDVLENYFQAVDTEHPTIERAYRDFAEAEQDQQERFSGEQANRGKTGKRVPYTRDLSSISVSYEALKQLSYKRRSVRWFADKPVSRESLDKAITIASQAPSACNRQPFEFRIYDDPALVQEVAELPGGTTGYAHNIPVIVALIGRLRAYFSERDRHVVYIDASLAAMNFMLALETLGLSSCAINWPDVENREKAIDEVLKLAPDERPVMLIAVGYPDEEGMVAYSQKKDLSRIRSYNKQ